MGRQSEQKQRTSSHNKPSGRPQGSAMGTDNQGGNGEYLRPKVLDF